MTAPTPTFEVQQSADSHAAGIRIRGLTKTFGKNKQVVALDALDLDVQQGEVLALLGPSGCGKTTTLRSTAGLEEPDSGDIWIGDRHVFGGRRVDRVQAEDRFLGMVFQSYALWPHMTVADNVGYALSSRKVSKSEVRRRVPPMLELVGCGHLGHRYPSELSGGQQQRVALARALVAEPPIVLFDEPLSNLDARLRERMRFEIVELHERLGFTAIYVTHDHAEALTVSNRIAVMSEGRILQLGTGQALYETPVNAEVARFLGTLNEFTGVVSAVDRLDARTVRYAVKTRLGTVVVESGNEFSVNDEVFLAVRPENVQINPSPARGGGAPASGTWSGVVNTVSYQGANRIIGVVVGSERFIVHIGNRQWFEDKGSTVELAVPPNRWLLLPPRKPSRGTAVSPETPAAGV